MFRREGWDVEVMVERIGARRVLKSVEVTVSDIPRGTNR
jgi:hypothetical protein